jgi:hypothetical protein
MTDAGRLPKDYRRLTCEQEGHQMDDLAQVE